MMHCCSIPWFTLFGLSLWGFQLGKVWGMMRLSAVTQEHKPWATNFLSGWGVFLEQSSKNKLSRARVQFGEVLWWLQYTLRCFCLRIKTPFNDWNLSGFIPKTDIVPLYHRWPLSLSKCQRWTSHLELQPTCPRRQSSATSQSSRDVWQCRCWPEAASLQVCVSERGEEEGVSQVPHI